MMHFPFGPTLTKAAEDSIIANRKLIKGLNTMLTIEETEVGTTPKELIYEEDKVKLYRYTPLVKNIHPVPVLISYALVNRQYMMDLQQNRSIIRNWLELGLDVYIIDWGYPEQIDKYLTMEDYIDGYLNNAIDCIRERTGLAKINLLGVCQGGTMSVIYTALYPEKIANLITMVMPFDFSVKDGLLFSWSKYLNIDNIVDTMGLVPGNFMNIGFNMLKPFQLSIDKYVSFYRNMDNPEAVKDFLAMEKWIYDSPDQAGEMLRKFVKDLYHGNLLMQNKLEVGGRTVDVKSIEMPVLTLIAEQDHLVPPSSTRPFNDAVSSVDKQIMYFPGGHIGVFVSTKAQKEVAPAVANWLKERGGESPKRTAARKAGKANS
jgi:polyhydroxyalkanoate synthase